MVEGRVGRNLKFTLQAPKNPAEGVLLTVPRLRRALFAVDPYKRSHMVALRYAKISANDPP